MENFPYLFAAFIIIWAIVFGYVISMYARQKQLRRDIDLLKQGLNGKEDDTPDQPSL